MSAASQEAAAPSEEPVAYKWRLDAAGLEAVRLAIRDFWIHDVNKPSWYSNDQNERLVVRISKVAFSSADIREELERLRELKDHARKCCDTAEADLAMARKALEPFAALADIFDHDGGNRPKKGEIASWVDHRVGERVLTVEALRAARVALSSQEEKA